MKDWRFWLGVIISLGFMAYALQNIPDWHQMGRSLLSIKFIYLIPILGAYTLILLFRALRWQFILKSSAPTRFSSSLNGIIICYMGNNILPLRAGDVLRAVVVGKRENKSISAVLATVVVERLFDSLMILIFLSALLMSLTFPESYSHLENALHKGGIAALVLALALMVFLYLLYFWNQPMMKIISFFLGVFPKRWNEIIEGILNNFIQGLKILGSPSRLFITFLLSVVVWLVNLGTVYFVGKSMGIHIPFQGCLLLLFLGAFSSMIPAAPGYWGTFHVITAAGIKFLGLLPDEGALAYAIVLHAIYFFPVVIVGLFVAWREGYSLAQLRKEAVTESKT
jgi:uncharacterized protein (TIRG00374 family)